MPADVFFSAGEASGDLQASLLLGALRKLRPELRAAAVGGERLRSAGADVIIDSVAGGWASIGHLRAYLKIPWLLFVMLGLARRLLADPPRLLVCVDFGAFNLRMLEWLRFCGYRGRTLYYFPPGAWIDNAAQARKVARVSAALTPFLHQAEFYRSLGLPVEYFGHPLAQAIAPLPLRAVASPPTIAVMPGSRGEEVARHLPVLSAAAERLKRERSARFVVVAASDGLERDLLASWPEACGGSQAVVRASAADAVAGADAAWVASGTAVLETALRGVPQVAFYRLSEAQYRMALERIPHIARGPITLPNLVMRESVVPELLQYDFTPEGLVETTTPLLDDADARDRMRSGYARLREALGPPDALDRIAAFASRLIAPDEAS
jgi:lipid-A-disaccharide synthase